VKTITALAAKKVGKFLAKDFRRFCAAHDDMAERLALRAPLNVWQAMLAPYFEHTPGHDGRTTF
jgi:hypothetical protein